MVKEINRINSRELELGINGTEAASWHSKYKDSAYVFIGNIDYELTEGDILCVFSQFGVCFSHCFFTQLFLALFCLFFFVISFFKLKIEYFQGRLIISFQEPCDVNLVRDKKTGKSKGFAFLAYQDQRSTILAVDNFNGAQLCGRTIRVDHVHEYKVPKKDDEEGGSEEDQKKSSRDNDGIKWGKED